MIHLIQVITHLIRSGQVSTAEELRTLFDPFIDGGLTDDILFDELEAYGIELSEGQRDRMSHALPKFEGALRICLMRLGLPYTPPATVNEDEVEQ